MTAAPWTFLLCLFAHDALAGEGPTPVEVVLSFEDASRHLVRVEASYPAAEGPRELVMASWTPGSYKIRDYAKHVEHLEVFVGDTRLDAPKVAKNRWRVESPEPIRVRYDVYAHDMGVQTSFVDDDLAILSGAGLFLYELGVDSPWDVTVRLPEGWTAHTGLDPVPDAPGSYRAEDIHELIDSPWLMGRAEVSTFEVNGVRHELVNLDFGRSWDAQRAVEDVQKLVQTQVEFWGQVPYERYVFLNAGTGGGGGLEHLDSTLMITGPEIMHDSDSYERWLGLVSHEFFHTWNVKRLRPVEYGPFDYEREVHSESLWVAEGITSYYDGLLLHRAGLIDEDAWLGELSRMIDRLQNTPGRQVRSVSQASFDAWIKLYQRDENTGNTNISYYTKGAVVAFLLDAEIRKRTRSKASLDDVMRLAYERYSGERGFSPDEFDALIAEVAGEDLGEWMDRAVRSTEELPYEDALAFLGLEWSTSEGEDASPWLGVDLDGSGVVSRVRRGGPAWEAGVGIGDELIAVDGERIRDLAGLLSRRQVGDEVELLFSRRGRLDVRAAVLGAKPEPMALRVVDSPKGPQKKAYQAWLEGQ